MSAALLLLTLSVLVNLAGASPAAADDSGGATVSRALSVGPDHGCALLDKGKVTCWGRGDVGQLGYGDTSGVGDGIGADLVDVAPVKMGAAVQSVAVGDLHSCALLSSGAVRCWGKGDDGRLGYASQNNVGDTPRRSVGSADDVEIGGPARVVAVGGDTTCVVLDGGAVKCWGRASEPAVVALEAPAIDLGVGPNEACAVLEAGAVQCWAARGRPQVVPLDDVASAVAVGAGYACALLASGQPECWGPESDPLPIDTDAVVVDLSVGTDHACGIDESQGVWCWSESEAPQEMELDAAAISVGDASACVFTAADALHCWGDGAWGILGRGDVDSRTVDGSVQVPASGSTSETQVAVFGGGSVPDSPDSSSSGGAGLWLLVLVVPFAAAGAWFLRRRSRTAGGIA